MPILKQSRSRDQYVAMLHNDVVINEDKLTNMAKVYMDNNGDIQKKGDENKELEEEERCAWGRFSPSICQRFRNPKWMLFWLCWAGAIQGMVVNGFVNVVISSVERRYDLSSTESGAIASCYDIASVLLLIPVSYFGGLGCKPRYLGIGVFVMGIGSFVFSIPQFTSGLYQVVSADDSSLCKGTNSTSSYCSDSNTIEGLSNYKYVFYLGQLLHGAGAAPLYTLGVTYLDENVPVASSSLYLGIFYAFAILGPAIGYLAGGAFLDFYVDINKVSSDSVTVKPTSPRFVGAWWMGFLLSGALAFLVCVPICGFPQSLPGSSVFKEEKGKEVYKAKTKEIDANTDTEISPWKARLWKIITSVKILLTNPTFMFLNLAAACEGNLLAGFATFAPKFIQEQFSLSSSVAAIYIGYAAIPAGGGGTFLGGYLVKKFNMRIKGIIKLCLGVTLPCLGLALVFLIQCSNVNFAGVNYGYGTSINQTTFRGEFQSDDCHSSCSCSLDHDYNPVCGTDGIVYFSPCHAGCTNVKETSEKLEYYNCSCIVGSDPSNLEAVYGKCESSCTLLPVFMPIFGVLMLLTFMASMPALSATLRCVPQEDRSFALGIQWIIARCLGSIPGPILFGKLIDIACELWQTQCGELGSCLLYSNTNMSYNLLSIGIALKALSSICFLLSLLLYKRSSDEDGEDNHSTETERTNVDQNNTLQKRDKKIDNSVDTLTTSIQDELPNNNGIVKEADGQEMKTLSPDNVV